MKTTKKQQEKSGIFSIHLKNTQNSLSMLFLGRQIEKMSPEL